MHSLRYWSHKILESNMSQGRLNFLYSNGILCLHMIMRCMALCRATIYVLSPQANEAKERVTEEYMIQCNRCFTQLCRCAASYSGRFFRGGSSQAATY